MISPAVLENSDTAANIAVDLDDVAVAAGRYRQA
jgi:hypothetical protein